MPPWAGRKLGLLWQAGPAAGSFLSGPSASAAGLLPLDDSVTEAELNSLRIYCILCLAR